MDAHIKQLTDTIRTTSLAIHSCDRNGHVEKIYENALLHRLRKLGLQVERRFPLDVFDEDGTLLGEFKADLLVEKCIIIEVKAARTIVDDHIAQLLGYLRASRIEHGLLINFGAPKLQIRKFIMTPDYYDPR